MRPLRKGKTRTELAAGLSNLLHKAEYSVVSDAVSDDKLNKAAQLQATVLGGAIEQALEDMLVGQSAENKVDFKQSFWRYTNENLWRLTRALEASRLLDKAGDT